MKTPAILESSLITQELLDLYNLNRFDMFEFPRYQTIETFKVDKSQKYELYVGSVLVGLGLTQNIAGACFINGCIHPLWQRKGLGFYLFSFMLNLPGKLKMVQVLKDNINAINFLFSLGLIIQDKTPNTFLMGAN